eukprot:3042798-Ditylum_brightwellii.AAC.1
MTEIVTIQHRMILSHGFPSQVERVEMRLVTKPQLWKPVLVHGQYKTNGDLNKDNPLGTGGRLLEEFSDLLRIMWSGKYGSRAPTRFRSQLGKARSQYSGADQQDAQ